MSRPVLIVDTSVWIDLAQNTLLEYVLRLPHEIMISHFVWDELQTTPTTQELEEVGLTYREFLSQEMDPIISLKARYKGLSLADASNLALAHLLQRRHVVFLATADSQLRKAAVMEGIDCIDALDLLDDWVRTATISLDEARQLAWQLRRGRPQEAEQRYRELICYWETMAVGKG